jgi:cell division protein FtsB
VISKKNILLAAALVVVLFLLMFILFGKNGLSDLNRLKAERDGLLKKNAELIQQNLLLCREIERLKTDPEYIKSLARKELGMIGKDEVVIKVKKRGTAN